MVQNAVLPERKIIYFLKGRNIHMKVAICDDDEMLIEKLKPIVYQYANKHKFEMVIEKYYSGEALINSKNIYDMILLDFKMGELNGLDAARKLREKNINCAIIFMTSYPDFIREAFEVSTFRFFDKPVEISKLYTAFDDYFKMYGNDFPIILQHNRENVHVDTKDIIFLEASNKHCEIHLAKKQMRVARTMAVISKKLPMSHFYKVHRAFIINFNYISKYNSIEIIMKNGEKVPVSRKYLTAFKKAFRDYSDLRNPKRQERNSNMLKAAR